ncbi:4116_t:CDS:2, partial [Dentiscutata erythropus]
TVVEKDKRTIRHIVLEMMVGDDDETYGIGAERDEHMVGDANRTYNVGCRYLLTVVMG